MSPKLNVYLAVHRRNVSPPLRLWAIIAEIKHWGTKMSQELLFSKGDIFGAIRGQEDAIKKRIQSIPPGTIQHAIVFQLFN